MDVHVRKFRPEVYNKVDGPSKQALIKYLEAEGHTIVDSKEDFYADVKSTISQTSPEQAIVCIATVLSSCS